MTYNSHPQKLLITHIANIKKYDEKDSLFIESATYHDLAKVVKNFQDYLKKEKKDSEPHALPSAIIYLFQKFADGYDLSQDKASFFVFNVILSHHIKLKNFRCSNINGQNSIDDILHTFSRDVPKEVIEEILLKKDVVNFFDLKPVEHSNLSYFAYMNEELKFTFEDFITQKLLFSKLIFADKYEAIFNDSFEKRSFQGTLLTLENYLKAKFTKTDEKSEFRNSVKRYALEKQSQNKSRIYTITAPTGVGKTLLSLQLALTIQKEKALDKIIYILPFTSIIDQSFEIFSEIFPELITKHHHKVEYKEEENESQDDYDRWKFLLNSWSDSFIVSTMYQFLFALFSNQNLDNVKFQGMQRSVIVIDEVQGIPYRLYKTIKALLPILAEKLDSTFILMSATMPLLTDSSSVELVEKEKVFAKNSRYTLEFADLSTLDALSEQVVEEYQQKRSVLVIVNTIKNAKILYQKVVELIKKESVFCLNSYMFYDDRVEVIEKLQEEKSNQVVNKILISTQVIEAGVDLDFDVGFRELAPISSIVQSAGRVNREGKRDSSKVYVFNSLNERSIYDEKLMNPSNILFEKLQESPLDECELLPFIEKYFLKIYENIQDSNLETYIENFDFDSIAKVNKEAFNLDENDYIESVAIGVDLKREEQEFFEETKDLGFFDTQKEKEKIFKTFQSRVLNIKKKDLSEVVAYSNIFSLTYITYLEGLYSKETGFIIAEEKEVEDDAFL